MRHRLHKPTAAHRPGRLAIVITKVRTDHTTPADTLKPGWYQDDPARNQKERPEEVVKTIPLSEYVDVRYAQDRADAIYAGFSPEARGHFRVKVVGATR